MDFNNSDQTVTWLRDRYREGNLIIKPTFQRKPVWAAKQKCYLIESILLSLPVPEIYVQQTISEDGDVTYAVVDGQQRIRTVLQFLGHETDVDEAHSNDFILDKLEATSPWKDKSFADLSPEERKSFYEYEFSVRFLKTSSDWDVRDMFRRLNKFLTPLKPQELRNATYSGPFVELAEMLANYEYWVSQKIVSAALIRRMTDIEYVSELLIGVLHGPQGGSSKLIDDYYRLYEDYEIEFPEQKAAKALFDRTLDTVKLLFPNISETLRWSNRTDFYSLFVALAALLRTGHLKPNTEEALRKRLNDFAREVSERITDDKTKVSAPAAAYARAVQKGANDKARRAERNSALIRIMKPSFVSS